MTTENQPARMGDDPSDAAIAQAFNEYLDINTSGIPADEVMTRIWNRAKEIQAQASIQKTVVPPYVSPMKVIADDLANGTFMGIQPLVGPDLWLETHRGKKG